MHFGIFSLLILFSTGAKSADTEACPETTAYKTNFGNAKINCMAAEDCLCENGYSASLTWSGCDITKNNVLLHCYQSYAYNPGQITQQDAQMNNAEMNGCKYNIANLCNECDCKKKFSNKLSLIGCSSSTQNQMIKCDQSEEDNSARITTIKSEVQSLLSKGGHSGCRIENLDICANSTNSFAHKILIPIFLLFLLLFIFI